MLSIYVDGFKLAGPTENLAPGSALLREVVDVEDPAPATFYFGCTRSLHALTMPDGAQVQVMAYDVRISS